MSVVMVTNNKASARWWAGYHGVELAPAGRVGAMPAAGPVRLVTMVAVLCAAVVAAVGLTPSPVGPSGGGGAVAAVAGTELPIVPQDAIGPISSALGRDLAGYRVAGLTATNAGQDLRAAFSSRGVTVVSGGLRLGIALDGYGYAGAAGAVPRLSAVTPIARANRALYAHGALSEWWANGPAGLEQGFTVSSAPGVGTGPLTFSLGLSGNLRPRLDGGGVYLSGPGAALRYDDLAATDARGRALPARFALRDGQVLIEVDDRGAAYPVRVDPLVHQSGELISSDGTPSGEFGRSVAVSGNTVAVAADNQTVGSRQEDGAVYVFVEPAAGWSELMTQTAELVASDPQDLSGLGWSLGMSATTIVAGAPDKCNKWAHNPGTIKEDSYCLNEGAAYVFEQPSGGWSGTLTQNAVLTSSIFVPRTAHSSTGLFGSGVAISGGTIVVGGAIKPVGGTNVGVVCVFEEPAGGWSGAMTEDAQLTPSDPANNEGFGPALAVSGSTVVVGAPGFGAPFGGRAAGAAYVFEEPAGGWPRAMTQSATLTGPAGAGTEELGGSVAVSGTSAVVGAPFATVGRNTDQGAVFVYNEPTPGWSGTLAPDAELTASDGTGDNSFGMVAASGTTIAVGEQDGNPGSLDHVYLFSSPAAGWSGHLTESSELSASNEAVTDAFGSDVALSCGTVVVGADGHHRLGSTASSQGAAYVFAPPTTTGPTGAASPLSALTPLGPSSSTKSARAPFATLKADAATSGAACPLNVTVTALEPLPVRAGLALHSQPYAPSQYPVDFVQGKSGTERCESGCVDLRVTVTNPLTRRPVSGATINASISDVNTTVVSGKQSLCATDELGTRDLACGLSIIGSRFDLQTDSQGHVYLRYWAPGVVEPTSTLLRLLARVTCSKLACPTGHMVGAGDTTLNIGPDLVYSHTGALSSEQVDALAEWAAGGNAFTKTLEKVTQANTVLKVAIKALEHNELLEKEVVEHLEVVEQAEPLALVIDAINILTAVGERSAMVAEFFYCADLDAVGLGVDLTQKTAVTFPSLNFSKLLVNFGVAAPFHFGVAGAWWEFANTLRVVQEADHGPIFVDNHSIPHNKIDFSDWGLKLKVWEVSTCDPGAGSCEPGYSNDVGSSTVLRAGIKPVLCFDLVLTYNGYHYDDFPFETSYDAIAWEQTQWNLQGLIRG